MSAVALVYGLSTAEAVIQQPAAASTSPCIRFPLTLYSTEHPFPTKHKETAFSHLEVYSFFFGWRAFVSVGENKVKKECVLFKTRQERQQQSKRLDPFQETIET